MDDLRKRRPGDVLDGVDEKHVPDVRVGPTLAGTKEKTDGQHGFEKLASRPWYTGARAHGGVIAFERPVLAKPARVSQQARHRDAFRQRYVGDIETNRRVERHQVLLGKP